MILENVPEALGTPQKVSCRIPGWRNDEYKPLAHIKLTHENYVKQFLFDFSSIDTSII